MFLISALSSSESDDELPSPSYASFLQYDHKPVYSDVVKKQMVRDVQVQDLRKHASVNFLISVSF